MNFPKFCPICNSKNIQQKYIVERFNIYYCRNCTNAFTFPIPKNLGEYYHKNYWASPGLLGKIKDIIFNIFQTRRKGWIHKYLKNGSLLEIGPGEGAFIKKISNKYEAIGIEFSGARIKNNQILRVDFLKWKTAKKFDSVVFWESFEHVQGSREYLQKSFNLTKNGSYLFIEIPRFDSLESRLFAKNWFHLDPPRHTIHFSKAGLKKLVESTGYKVISIKSVLALEYAIWGFAQSTVKIFGLGPTENLKKNKYPLIFPLFLPLLVLAFFAEIYFQLIDQSPILLLVAKKDYAKEK